MQDGLTGRFLGDLARLTGATTGERFGIAVSGGPDSLALLLLAHAAVPGAVEAATVDHGLRAESAAEAAMVADIAARLPVPHATLRPARPITGSLQASARAARYGLLEAWRAERNLDWILTAHHADDQAETVMMRLNRGAGAGGLAGIRAVNGRIARPLLGWRRAELAAIVAAAGIAAVDDPANRDKRFDRARIRQALCTADWIDPTALATSAAHVAAATDALDWATDALARERLSDSPDGALCLDPAGLPPEFVRRLALRAIERLDPGRNPSGPELDRLLDALAGGRKASIGALLASGGTLWRFAPAPPRRPN